MVKPVIHSTKHYVQISLGTVAAGAITSPTLVKSVAVVDKNISTEVEEGASIKAVFVELWVTGDDVVKGSGIFSVEKFNGTGTTMTAANSADLNSYLNKKNLLQVHQGLVNPENGVAMPIFREWIKIPKSKQRFGLGDHLFLNIHGQSDGLDFCGFATYKEYT